MEENLKRLLALQELDLEIKELAGKKETLENSLIHEETVHNKRRQNLEEEKNRFKKNQSEIKQLELAVESLQEKRRKLEAQQVAVKTNQEYKALSKEILDVFAEIDRTEEQMLKKMEDLEEEKTQVKRIEDEVKAQEEKLALSVKEIRDATKSMDEKIAEINLKRNEIIPLIDRSIAKTYDRIFRRTGGPAIVPIVNRSCAGCHLSVTPQIVNMAARNEELILCENCSRILYYPSDTTEEEQEAAAGDEN